MINGVTLFKCDECKKVFLGLAMEWRATAFTAASKCSKCGSWHTYPLMSCTSKSFYKKIWKSIDERE